MRSGLGVRSGLEVWDEEWLGGVCRVLMLCDSVIYHVRNKNCHFRRMEIFVLINRPVYTLEVRLNLLLPTISCKSLFFFTTRDERCYFSSIRISTMYQRFTMFFQMQLVDLLNGPLAGRRILLVVID